MTPLFKEGNYILLENKVYLIWYIAEGILLKHYYLMDFENKIIDRPHLFVDRDARILSDEEVNEIKAEQL